MVCCQWPQGHAGGAAAQDAGITPLVRVPGHEPFHASRALDGGAQGIVAPHVDTAEQAAQVVSACRYPPHGKRSVTGALPQLDFRSLSVGEATEAVDEATLVVVMAETPAAIENLDEIAAVPGVDAVLIGTNDLCMEMGRPGEFGHSDVEAAYRRLVEVCRRHGKHPGMGGVYDHALMQRYIDIGARLILSGSDYAFLMAGARSQASAVRGMLA